MKNTSKMYKTSQIENMAIITQETVRQCLLKGIHVTEECVEFMLKLLLLDSESAHTLEVPITEDDLKHLVKLCVDKLSEKRLPSLMTLKMQAYFNTNYTSQDQIIRKNRTEIKLQTYPVIKEITQRDVTGSKEELEKLYGKLVIAVILGSGLGHPSDTSVLKEATAALQSVFPLSEMGQFMKFGHKEREQQIKELTRIVTGIRLFNRDCHKGGAGVDDLPNILQQAVSAAHGNLQANLKKLMDHVNVLTAAVDAGWRCLVLPRAETAKEISWSDVELFRDMLLLARQQEAYLRKLLVDVESSHNSIENLLIKLQKVLLKIHDSVRFRTAIPIVEVYPQFIKLSEIWTGLQDEMVILTSISGIMWNLQRYAELLEHSNIGLLDTVLGNSPILTDEARLQATMGTVIDHAKMACELIHPPTFPDFDRISLQYQGFCPWALVKGRGALLPANQNMGVVYWQGKYYAFSSPEAAYEFDSDPKYYTSTITALAHFVPELVNFLLADAQVSPSKSDQEPKPSSTYVIKLDNGMQTDLHPIPSHIEPDYSWNTWELKRKAIQLANICNSQTRSTQTHTSRGWKNIGIQAQPPKEAASQTKRDGFTYMPQPRNFIFGLRGHRQNVQHVIPLFHTRHQ